MTLGNMALCGFTSKYGSELTAFSLLSAIAQVGGMHRPLFATDRQSKVQEESAEEDARMAGGTRRSD